MKTNTKILLLTFVGFLHFKRADGYPNFPADHIVLTMHDGCIGDGNILRRPANQIPLWLYLDTIHADVHLIFIRIAERRYAAVLNQPHVLFRHDPARHIPRNVQINIGTGQFYLANSFQVYNVSQHEEPNANGNFSDHFILNNHIYISVPGDKVFIAALQHQPYAKGIDRQPYLSPRIS